MGERSEEVGRKMQDKPRNQSERQGTHPADCHDGGQNALPDARRRLSGERDEINPDPSAAPDELERTRQELARTRAQMSETIEVLEGRMNSGYIKEQARNRLSSSARGSGSSVAKAAKENPVPLALVGAGLGWLLVNAGSSAKERAQQDSGQRQLTGGNYREYSASDYPYDYSQGDGRRRTEEGYGSSSAGSSQGTQPSTDQARQRASEASGQAQEKARQGQQRAQQEAQRAKGGFQSALQESPLTLGAAAIVLGATVGLSMPSTSKENEMMGESSDRFKEQARHKAQEAKERGQRVAQDAKESAKQEASQQSATE